MSTQDEQKNKLLTVEATFPLTGRGLIVVPGPSLNRFGTDGRTQSCEVLIKRPDGHTLITTANFYFAHFSPPEAQLRHLEYGRYTCVLSGANKLDVPIGSELYEHEAEIS